MNVSPKVIWTRTQAALASAPRYDKRIERKEPARAALPTGPAPTERPR